MMRTILSLIVCAGRRSEFQLPSGAARRVGRGRYGFDANEQWRE
jgi:hypothetical protein